MMSKAIAFLSILAVSALSMPVFSQEKIDLKSSNEKNSTTDIKPWSDLSISSPAKKFETVSIKDKSGQYVAAIDKNWEQQWGDITDRGIISYWHSDKIRIYAYSIANNETVVRETNTIAIQVRNKTYQLKGDKSYYKVTPELAYALKTAPREAVKIKIEFANGSIPIVGEIGMNTLTALRTLYQQANAPVQILDFQQIADRLFIAARDKENLQSEYKK
jgi:hypothetical protein